MGACGSTCKLKDEGTNSPELALDQHDTHETCEDLVADQPRAAGQAHVPDQPQISHVDTQQASHEPRFVEQYEMKHLLFQGYAGEVWLAVDTNASGFCVVKQYQKRKAQSTHVDKSSIAKSIGRMRSIYEEVNHQFLVPFLRNMETEDAWYSVLGFLGNGSVRDHLDWFNPVGLSEAQAKFYIAQTMSAVRYLHGLKIVHRGIRSDVLLLEPDGFCKLGGFFHARHLESGERTYSIACGDAHYMAPEVLLAKGYGRSVDHYAIGVLSYELLVGTPPYMDEDMPGLYQKVINCKVYYPGRVCKDGVSFIKKLIKIDPSKRLGSGQTTSGIDELASVPWFHGFAWDDLEQRRVPQSCGILDVKPFEPSPCA
eukprot:TRINITY_DN31306_c0_g1_i1.p1 TRINITY_DN31306_c0_g1~~TRINITY_DN31306_c0_g1_i1.p1  ORF type:complete len:388 (-),score=41.05 TRINITY_DN31306_c0_g1_i1:123-1229(-)